MMTGSCIIDGIDLFFMGGSVPPGVDKSIYKDIINLGSKRGNKTKFILDCDGEALKMCMENVKKPYIIKPNQFELEQYINRKFDLENSFDAELEKIKRELKKVREETGVIILCTLGEHGGLYCGAEGVYYIKPPKVEVRGFAGAGDTFLTAFAAVYFGLFDLSKHPPSADRALFTKEGNGKDAETALRFAVAASAAKVTKPGTEFASVDEIIMIYDRITKLKDKER